MKSQIIVGIVETGGEFVIGDLERNKKKKIK